MAPELLLSGASSILLIALVRCILFEIAVTALLICVVPSAAGVFGRDTLLGMAFLACRRR
jgi:hypothetical protein